VNTAEANRVQEQEPGETGEERVEQVVLYSKEESGDYWKGKFEGQRCDCIAESFDGGGRWRGKGVFVSPNAL